LTKCQQQVVTGTCDLEENQLQIITWLASSAD